MRFKGLMTVESSVGLNAVLNRKKEFRNIVLVRCEAYVVTFE